mmetsp:Transcript_22835/g.41502  ORF Transcript_22835/g.41502 Transcript_22835/m.41502 type:complete len:136 (-) Transcript_22835:54-461(-)
MGPSEFQTRSRVRACSHGNSISKVVRRILLRFEMLADAYNRSRVWLVCDRDWSNKVVNDTMAECFLREPEDNKANDDENPRATEVVSTENAVIPVEENPGAAEVDMSGNAVGPVKENPGAPEVDMAEDQDGGFDA